MFVFPENTDFNYDSIGLAPWVMKVNPILFAVLGESILRTLIFVGFFLSGVFFYGIAQKINFFNSADRKILTLFFLLLPFNTSRVALMVLHYSEAYFLFFFGWYLAVTFKSPTSKYVCVALFFLSFQMHSLLFFYLLPIIHMFFLSKKTEVKKFRNWSKSSFIFLLLPITYYVLRSLYWPEQVAYHGALVSEIDESVGFLGFVSFLGFGFYFLYRRTSLRSRSSVLMISVGFLAVIVGIYPYVLYGYFVPNESMPFRYLMTLLGRTSWYVRHQTLQPLGISLVILGSLNYLRIKTGKLLQLGHHLVLVVCVVLNLGFGLEFVVDHSKQREIVSQLIIAGESESVNHYEFLDQSWFLSARGQLMPGIGWRGLIGLAYSSSEAGRVQVGTECVKRDDTRLVLIQGPETHWDALKNWVSDGDMGFKVTVDDTPGACKPEMVTSEKVSGAIPILFYFTGAKG